MNIIIVACGWYGLHTYLYLKKKLKNSELIIVDKEEIFFNNSSNFNQNRLHLGYHYPRSKITRDICYDGYFKFIEKYREVIDFIDNNYYMIANESLLDYHTYLTIFSSDKYQHNIIENKDFLNIDGNIINTKEKIINSDKVKKFFKKRIIPSNLKLGYKVKSIKKENNKIIVNNELECDILIDCSYNQLNLSKKKYIYEITISLLYDRINFDLNFESLTIMDGNFFSLFPRDISKKQYTLTHVKYTPIFSSHNIEAVLNYKFNESKLKEIKKNMENEVLKIYESFNSHFEYNSYFLSFKCKLKSNTGTRECIIEDNDNVISVNCGKIIGIFEFEKYLNKKFNIN